DPADRIFGHPPSHDDAYEGEREGQDQERRTADAREDVARKDAPRADQQQHDRRTPAHHAQEPDDQRDSAPNGNRRRSLAHRPIVAAVAAPAKRAGTASRTSADPYSGRALSPTTSPRLGRSVTAGKPID